MENNEENPNPHGDLQVQTENIAYDSAEMIECEKCRRANPPNRLKCLYCGSELRFSDAQSENLRPVLRKLEAWEKGFNLIYIPDDSANIDAPKIKEIHRMTRIETEALQKFFDAKKPLPLARAESEKEAEIVRQRFAEIGIETVRLSDEKLAVETPPTRLRGLEFSDAQIFLITFNTDEVLTFERSDLELVVVGSIFQKRVESTEKRNKKGENTLLGATETASDERIVDLYFRGNETGFRIAQKGFDFSALEEEKALLASENIERIAKKLKSFAPDSKLIEDYLPNRAVIGLVWEINERKDSKGLVRESFGKSYLGNVTTVSNLEQFTKYSRMQKNLL